jgi:SHS2 domain-containing protein
MGYTFIDHTADVAAELTGGSAEDLFMFAAQSLTDTLSDLSCVRASVTQSVTLESGSLEDLLVDWLNELLYRFEVQNMLASGGTVTLRETDGRWHLRASITGEAFDPARHPSRVLVKSATYHGLHITQTSGIWSARIVFDI